MLQLHLSDQQFYCLLSERLDGERLDGERLDGERLDGESISFNVDVGRMLCFFILFFCDGRCHQFSPIMIKTGGPAY